MCCAVVLQAEPFEPEVEEDADDTQQQQQQRPDKQGSAAAAPVKPMPVVIRPKGLIPGAKPQPAKPAAVAAVKLPAAAAAGGSSGGAAAEKAAVLMKEFAQPVPAAAGGGGTAKRVVKVGVVVSACVFVGWSWVWGSASRALPVAASRC